MELLIKLSVRLFLKNLMIRTYLTFLEVKFADPDFGNERITVFK